MKKNLFLLVLFMMIASFVSAIDVPQFPNGLGTKKKGKGNRTFGIGLNYTYPATGLSARFGFTENFKGQVSVNYRSYGVAGAKYSWSNIGAELNYAFDEKKGGLGAWYPFLYAGAGRGAISWKESVGIDNYSWFGWSAGLGLELFPEFFGGNFGINWKVGLGSYGSYGVLSETITGVVYGAGFHYYFK
jgi:hypothetical protein